MKNIIKTINIFVAITIISNILFIGSTAADSFNQGNIIDDQLYDNSSAMNVSQINNFINSFPGSCISTNNGFTSGDPTGYTPSGSFTYGSNVSAGQVIADAGLAYGLNPQVILTTLEKEQSLVTGSNGCSTLRYSGAAGYGCPDGGTTYNYSGVNLYAINGQETTSVNGTCINTSAKVGFSQQVIHAAWLLKFGEQRSKGNSGWDVQNTNFPQNGDVWNNSDDPQSCYGGPTTQGTYQICPGGSSSYYDGYYTIDGTSVYIQNGATAALYWYTPHFNGNQNFDTIFTNWFGSTSSCDYPKGYTAPISNSYNSESNKSLSGNWISSSSQGFAYATPNSSGGFDVGVMAPSGGSLQWQGTWWHQNNPAINLDNTVFITAKNSNGLTDIYYASSANWSNQGFSVGLMHNTGTGLVYGGQVWSPSSLSLSRTKFIDGNWLHGSISQGFAYATPNSSGGFDVGVMAPSGGSLQWQGTWWHQNNPAINLGDTLFIPADTNGDGLTDIYYASSVNWSIPGFTVGLMNNSTYGFSWQGTQWTNSNLYLGTTNFISGNWTSASNQGFAYATSCGSRGFDLSIMAPSPTGLQWQGVWWSARTLPYTSTALVPADTDGNGYTDLLYATPNGNYGFTVALQHNNGVGNNFNWWGTQWSPDSIPLSSTMFLP